MLRIIRIMLLALVPTLALGALVTACSDDTTGTTTQDMAVTTTHDLATGTVHDLAQGGD